MNVKSFAAALALLAFAACNPGTPKTQNDVQPDKTTQPVEVVYHVDGMTCDHCEESIQKGVSEVQGVSLVEANHEDSTTRVIYDPGKTDSKTIVAAIEKRGYTVVQPQ